MAKTATRLYHIVGPGTNVLIEAANPAQALRAVVKGSFTVNVPNGAKTAMLMAAGSTLLPPVTSKSEQPELEFGSESEGGEA